MLSSLTRAEKKPEVLVVAAGIFIYEAFRGYEAAKHKKKISDVNSLARDSLISVGLPEIFPVSKKNPDGFDSLHKPDAQIRKIGEASRNSLDDPVLAQYKLYICEAIAGLKDYYFRHEDDDKNGVTGGVIGYLLDAVDSYCQNFQDCDLNVSYATALSTFIQDYASQSETEKSQHYTYLMPVYKNLQLATKELHKLKQTLSLNDTLKEWRATSDRQFNQLIKILLRLTTDATWEAHVDTVQLTNLRHGLVRPTFTNSQINLPGLGHIVLSKDDSLFLPDSIFKDWIQALVTYYLDVLDPTKVATIPAVNFTYPRSTDSSLSVVSDSRRPQREPEGIDPIKAIFKRSNTFVSTKRMPNDTFEPVQETKEILTRVPFIAQIAELTFQKAAIMDLTTEIINAILLLGNLDFEYLQHYQRIFAILNSLADRIDKQAQQCQQTMQKLLGDSESVMQLAPKSHFTHKVEACLEKIVDTDKQYCQKIQVIRSQQGHAITEQAAIGNIKHTLFTAAESLNRRFNLVATAEVKRESLPVAEVKEVEVKVAEDKEDKQPALSPISQEQQIDACFTVIFARFAQLKPAQSHPIHVKIYQPYEQLSKVLQELQEKTQRLRQETVDRDKIKVMMDLTLKVCAKIQTFLNGSDDDRKNKRAQFVADIHALIAAPANQVLDQFQKPWRQKLASVGGIHFFHPTSHKLITKLEEACQGLVPPPRN